MGGVGAEYGQTRIIEKKVGMGIKVTRMGHAEGRMDEESV
jgi:hypothetical protein